MAPAAPLLVPLLCSRLGHAPPWASLSQWLSTVRIWQSLPIGHLCSDSASSGWSFSGHVVHSSSYPPHPSSLSPLSGVRLNMASLPATLGPCALFFRGLTNHLHVWIPVPTSTSQGTWVDTVRQLSTVADCFVLKYLLPFLSCKRVIYPCLLPWHPLVSKMWVEVICQLRAEVLRAAVNFHLFYCSFPCHRWTCPTLRAGPQNEDDI